MQEIGGGTVKANYTYGLDLINQSREGSLSYYQYDGLGSTRSLTDASGVLTDQYNYEAFGELLNSTGSTQNSYLYTGEQFDSSLDQYYLRARYYDQSIGRFTQQDTWQGNSQEPITLNKYLYANADPALYTDPSGHFGLVEMGVAMNVASILADMQIQSGMSLLDGALGMMGTEEEQESLHNAQMIMGIAMLGTGGLQLMKMLSSKVRKACAPGNSFEEDTLVHTEFGLKKIQDIKIGEMVWAYNEETGVKSLQTVVHLIQTEGEKQIVDIAIETGEVIKATAGHPFYVPGMEGLWVMAGDLEIEYPLLKEDGIPVSIIGLTKESRNAKVYNLTVANDHTYYVGLEGLLSHNSNCKLITAIGFPKTISRQRQNRHVHGTMEWQREKGGYFLNIGDAEDVLAAVHSGSAIILGKKKNGDLLVRYSGAQGFNNNAGKNIFDQPTNVFFIKKGARDTSVVPTSPNATPDTMFEN